MCGEVELCFAKVWLPTDYCCLADCSHSLRYPQFEAEENQRASKSDVSVSGADHQTTALRPINGWNSDHQKKLSILGLQACENPACTVTCCSNLRLPNSWRGSVNTSPTGMHMPPSSETGVWCDEGHPALHSIPRGQSHWTHRESSAALH